MIKRVSDIPQEKFRGLNTISDFFALTKEQTPNCMNVKFNFDGSMEKRKGYKKMNSSAIVAEAGSGFIVDSMNTLHTDLVSYWKLDEAANTNRSDIVGASHLINLGTTRRVQGKQSYSAQFTHADSGFLRCAHNSSFLIGNTDFSIALWFYCSDNTIFSKGTDQMIVCKGSDTARTLEWKLWHRGSDNRACFAVSTNGSDGGGAIIISSPILMTSTAWYVFFAGKSSNNVWLQEGSGDPVIAAYTANIITTKTDNLQLAMDNTASQSAFRVFDGAIDEMGFWLKALDSQNKLDLRN